MKECLHDFKTNEDYSDFCSKGCGETFQNYNTKLRNERITKLESDLTRVTELLKSACGLLLAINQEYQFLTIKEFFKNPEIKEIIK
jgi:hypothetical protein